MTTLSIHVSTRAVLGCLASITTVAAMTSMVIAARTDLRWLRTALVAYRSLTGTFPTTAEGLVALVTRPVIEPRPKTWGKVFEREILDPSGNKYVYKNPGERNPEGYDLFCMGADGKAGTSDDIWQE